MVTGSTRAARRTGVPVAVGALVMLTALIGPGWISGTVAVAGAFVAGWVNPDEPARAGLLTIALPVAGAVVRMLVDRPSAAGALVFGVLAAAALALVASHVGAGMALRRRPERDRPPR